MVINETGGQLGLAKGFGIDQGMQEADVGFYPGNAVLLQGLHHAVDGLFPGFVPHDELGDHRVVVDADFVAFGNAGIHPHVGGFFRGAQVTQGAGGRQEVLVRIFGVDARFQGVAAGFHLFLGEW